MIELLVAIVLLSLVLAGIGKVLIDSWSGSGKSVTQSAASSHALEAADRLRQDLLVTQTLERNAEKIRDPGQLQIGLLSASGLTVSDDPADNGASVDVRDILVASPTDLVVRANVVPEAVSAASAGIAECVEYRIVTTPDGWALRRWVRAGGNCAASLAGPSSDVLTSRVTGGGAIPTKVFTYGYLCNVPGKCNTGKGCVEQPAPATVTGAPMNWITSISVDVDAMTAHGDNDPSTGAAPTKISLRSRESGDYRQALGCA